MMTIIFCLEVFIKVIAHGFLFNGESSYLMVSWNRVDFAIVIISVLDTIISSEEAGDLSDGTLTSVKVIRLARLIRPMRLLSKNDGLKTAIQALAMSVGSILNLLVIVFLFMLIFGIIGVVLLKGRYEFCNNEHIRGLSDRFMSEVIEDKYDCINYGGEWENYD